MQHPRVEGTESGFIRTYAATAIGMNKVALRSGMFLFWSLLVCSAVLLSSLSSCGGGSSSTNLPPPSPGKIQHVVVIFQENRTPDNLFQDQTLVSRGADIQNYGVNSLGQKIVLTATALGTDYDLSHANKAFLDIYDGGNTDGADKIPVSCDTNASPPCPPPNPWFQYVNPSEVAPYFQLAETYTFGDRMFQTNQGPSFPAHQFIISGTSAPTPPGEQNSDLFNAENPLGVPSALVDTGCTAPAAEFVKMIDPSGSEATELYPCFDH